MRTLRFAAVPVLAAALLLAAWLVPPLLDWSNQRAAVAAFAAAGLGRPVRIDGPIRLTFFPTARLSAGRVTLLDTGDGIGGTIREMRLRVALTPLLAGRVVPQDLVLDHPSLHLPWPLALAQPTEIPAGLHASIEQGALALGALTVTGIDGEVARDPMTGLLSVAGSGSVLGRAWRITARLAQPGQDGRAAVEVSLDGQGPTAGTGALVSAQLDPQGGLSGRITATGPDLSVLLAAPPIPWRAEGHLDAGGGLAVADHLEIALAGIPARGSVALRFLPQLRLDATLAATRLDLDAWLLPLLHGAPVRFPTGIEVTAESATLAGGTLRRLHAGLELAAAATLLRDADLLLPGDAALHLAGSLAQGRFTGEARLAAPALAQTLAWLRPRMPALLVALPESALRSANLTASIQADAAHLALDPLQGDWNGAPLTGRLSLQQTSPALSANLRIDGPALDAFLPAALAPDLPRALGGLDADLTLTATRPLWRGAALDRLDLSGRSAGGVLELRRAALEAPGLSASLSGRLAASGQLSDGKLALQMEESEWVAPHLPGWLGFATGLLRGPGSLAAAASGDPASLAVSAQAELSDLQLTATGRADLPSSGFTGQASLRHPGAVRLLSALGLGGTAWLGEGSFSAQGGLAASPGRLSLSGLSLTAGALRGTAELSLAGLGQPQPNLTGTLTAETLPLPPILPHAADPLPAPGAFTAKLAIRAAHVLSGLRPALDDAAATLAITHDATSLDGVTGLLAGGRLTGQASLQAATPPRLSLSARLAGAAVEGGPDGDTIDVPAGTLDATADLTASGYSPAALLATLAGPVHLTVRDGTLTGLDAADALAALASPAPNTAAIAQDLHSGQTVFSRLDLAGTAAHGELTLTDGQITLPSGSIALTGSLDLPSDSLDAHLALRPSSTGAPTLGLRLIGPLDAPARVPDLADLARWIEAR